MKPVSAMSLLILAASLLSPGVSSQSTADCFSNLTLISEAEFNLTDLSVARKYILCQDTTFPQILILRSNATAQCGDDGSSANNCLIEQIDFAFAGIGMAPELIGLPDTVVENVLVQGITMDFFAVEIDPAPITTVFVAMRAGDVTFKDCVLSNIQGEPIFLFNQLVVPSSRRMLLQLDDESDGRQARPHPAARALASSATASTTFTLDSCLVKVRHVPTAFGF